MTRVRLALIGFDTMGQTFHPGIAPGRSVPSPKH